jgi:hypothetical protein
VLRLKVQGKMEKMWSHRVLRLNQKVLSQKPVLWLKQRLERRIQSQKIRDGPLM